MIRVAALLLGLVGPAVADDRPRFTAKSETADPPKELAVAIRELLTNDVVSVEDSKGTVCAFWLRKEVPATDGKAGLSYRSIQAGTLIGAVRLARSWIDFRHQEAPAGVYTLRIVVQPESKDHEGTAPHRDFCILCPAAMDAKPEPVPLKEMIKRSGSATGGTHAVVMLLYPHPKPPAEPVVLVPKKGSVAIGIKGQLAVGKEPAALGFAFTVRGTTTD